MLAGQDIVSKIIPQREPMIMVGSLISQDDRVSVTDFFIDPENIFVEDGVLSGEGLMENMAQSAALRTGWKGMLKSGNDKAYTPPVGVIGAVKAFRIFRYPEAGTLIRTEVTVQAEIFNATMISGKIMQEEEVLAEGELKIFLQGEDV